MSKETKYLVLSLGQIRELAQAAKLIDAKHGTGPHTRTSCVVLGLSVSEEHPRQANLESLRAVASDFHYHPFVFKADQNDTPLLAYTGPHLTGQGQ